MSSRRSKKYRNKRAKIQRSMIDWISINNTDIIEHPDYWSILYYNIFIFIFFKLYITEIKIELIINVLLISRLVI